MVYLALSHQMLRDLMVILSLIDELVLLSVQRVSLPLVNGLPQHLLYWVESLTATSTAGTVLTAAGSGRFTEVGGSVWSTGVTGQIELGGISQKVYNQWGNSYENFGYIKGGSIRFTLDKLPGGATQLYAGLGQQYGAPIPAITINASGHVKWYAASHSDGVTLATAQAGDQFYIHSAWGKYDLQMWRGSTLQLSAVNTYEGAYTLGGTQGFFCSGGASNTYGNADNPRITPRMQTVIF
jgi:hypothetical protein